MKEKYLVALEEVQNAINSNGSIDTGDISWDSLKNALELVKEQEQKIKELEELNKDKLELINKYHVVHLKDVEKELREMRKAIDTKNAEIECLNVIHESYKEMVAENNYISKDKIKEKIEEYNKMINATYADLTYYADYRRDVYHEIKNVLQVLLEEE